MSEKTILLMKSSQKYKFTLKKREDWWFGIGISDSLKGICLPEITYYLLSVSIVMVDIKMISLIIHFIKVLKIMYYLGNWKYEHFCLPRD